MSARATAGQGPSGQPKSHDSAGTGDYARRAIETVVSGQQIVRSDGRWDRVHGVDHEREQGVAVYVTTDLARDVRYELGTLVPIV